MKVIRAAHGCIIAALALAFLSTHGQKPAGADTVYLSNYEVLAGEVTFVDYYHYIQFIRKTTTAQKPETIATKLIDHIVYSDGRIENMPGANIYRNSTRVYHKNYSALHDTVDRVYYTRGGDTAGRVLRIGKHHIRFLPQGSDPDDFIDLNKRKIDSIVYGNGVTEVLPNLEVKSKMLSNIPELNTINYDLVCLAYLTFSISYERRLKNGLLGFRVPVYLGVGGGITGLGGFVTGYGNYNSQIVLDGQPNGCGFQIGFNPRLYLFKHYKVRAFIGPEGDIGFSQQKVNIDYYTYFNEKDFTLALWARFGLAFNPSEKFSLGLDGGIGGGALLGSPYPIGKTGVWHIGILLGGNFFDAP